MGVRAAALERLVVGAQELHEARASELLGFSHDLRNPLQIIRMSTQYLANASGVMADVDAMEAVRDIDQSVARMRRMLGDLVQLTKAHRDFVTMAPQRLETAELCDALGRRLRALVYGRDVRTMVSATREAPEHVAIDRLALDRIVDNLLTNAAKYTEHGSIAAELEGTPGYLVIKIADTGRGIEPEALEKVFEAGGSSVESRGRDSFGIGLSVVVRLLEQMGGRLEVVSRPGAGTTFWVYLPLRATDSPRGTPPDVVDHERESTASALSRVVTIRKSSV
jgi:signal transduction histidine kinase